MRNFTILLGWFVGTIALQGQPYDTQAFRSGLRGNPKQVTTTEHLFFTSNPTSENGQESYTVISTYNQQGICTGQKMFSIGGALIGTAEYKFDRNGNVYEIDYTGEYDDLAHPVVIHLQFVREVAKLPDVSRGIQTDRVDYVPLQYRQPGGPDTRVQFLQSIAKNRRNYIQRCRKRLDYPF